MHAKPGDRIIIKGHHIGEPDRDGEVLEARGPDGGPPYLVRWGDSGHTGLLFPGADARRPGIPSHKVTGSSRGGRDRASRSWLAGLDSGEKRSNASTNRLAAGGRSRGKEV